jgi:hypothetical protein
MEKNKNNKNHRKNNKQKTENDSHGLTINQWMQNHEVVVESILTSVAIAVAVLLFCVTRDQVRIARDALKSQDSLSTKSIALSKTIAKTQERAAIIDTRAYVIVDSIEYYPFIPGKKIQINIGCINTGRTPANQMQAAMIIKLGGHDMYEHEIRKFEKGLTDFKKSAPLGPGLRTYHEFTVNEIFTDKNSIAIFINKEPVFIIGMITYTDMFGGNDTTKFCYKFIAPGPFEIWTDYNVVK